MSGLGPDVNDPNFFPGGHVQMFGYLPPDRTWGLVVWSHLEVSSSVLRVAPGAGYGVAPGPGYGPGSKTLNRGIVCLHKMTIARS